ncbi:MarR family transcriptional regulator [Thiomicrorhabdus sp.]|uniref:MarR family winged helix-turn-helix transcriptional regulator n=1 Tax=Thiomicrorhabdus sp. TaxID=2039724 RepID=UPI0029C981C9|nr:MarR family transcriptional regulator [Thiomicrorhabdus sp.]
MTPEKYLSAEQLEKELTLLMRLLEALNRKRNYPLERSHYLLLLQIQDEDKNINDLANILALDATTVTRQVISMQKNGLIVKKQDPADRRVAWISASEKGKQLAMEMREIRIQRLDEMFREWAPEEKHHFSDLLNRCNQTLYHRLAEI